MRIPAKVLAAALVSGVLSCPAHAEPDPIGAASRVVDKVTAELDRETRDLATDDSVHQDELIAVSDRGLSELVLADETILALGPGARLTLDKFVYDPDKTGGAIVMNMTRGAFRFITGLAKKPSYVIRTPSASITVRGTIFDVYVEESGAVWMLLHEGAVQVCNDRGECQVLDDPCRAVRVDGGGTVGSPGSWSGLRRDDDVDFETAFPFVVDPPELDPEPRFERASVEAGRCGDGGGIAPPKPRRAEPYQPRYKPRIKKAEPAYVAPKKYKKAEPKYEPPAKKVKKVEPKYDPPPKKKVVIVTPPKKKYDDDKPKKKYKEKGDGGAKAAKALGFAIGVGLAIAGSKGGGKKKGSYGY